MDLKTTDSVKDDDGPSTGPPKLTEKSVRSTENGVQWPLPETVGSLTGSSMTSETVFLRRTKYKLGRFDSQVSTASKKSRPAAICQWFCQLLSRIFAFPLVPEPICFYRQGADSEPLDEAEEAKARHSRRIVEDMVNLNSDATKEILAKILERRKEIKEGRDKYHYANVDLTKYPGWEENSVSRLKAMFQIFDVSDEGLIDFEEISLVLTEFGDKTPVNIRKKYFEMLHVDEFGSIGFEDFIELVYNLTMKTIEPGEQTLADTFKKIEHNVSIRNKLDVLGQLQGGLF